jgi:mannose-6-phosphate isomerase-like protein (cupin superfamily)
MEILKPTEGKGEFFKILGTTEKSQVITMELKPGEDSGPEDIHKADQVAYVVEGRMRAVVDGKEGFIEKGEAVIIPAGKQHHLYNAGDSNLFVLNFYSSPEY